MSARDWLKDASVKTRESYDRVVMQITGMPGMDDPIACTLLARSWNRVADDLKMAGQTPTDEDMLRHVGGDTFMEALAVDGNAMLVQRQLGKAEEGSDEWLSLKGDLARFRHADTLLKALSSACETIRNTANTHTYQGSLQF